MCLFSTANSLLEESGDNQKEFDLKIQNGDETVSPDSDSKQDHSDPPDHAEMTKETEVESAEDIASQVIIVQFFLNM